MFWHSCSHTCLAYYLARHLQISQQNFSRVKGLLIYGYIQLLHFLGGGACSSESLGNDCIQIYDQLSWNIFIVTNAHPFQEPTAK